MNVFETEMKSAFKTTYDNGNFRCELEVDQTDRKLEISLSYVVLIQPPVNLTHLRSRLEVDITNKYVMFKKQCLGTL